MYEKACRELCKYKQTFTQVTLLGTDTGSLTGYALAKLCYKTLLKWGPQAVLANDNKVICSNCKMVITMQVIVPAFEKIVEANTLLSGLGFESAGLATAHSIHNGLTKLPETHSYCFCVVVLSFIQVLPRRKGYNRCTRFIVYNREVAKRN